MAEYIKKEDAVSVVLRQPFFQNSMATEIRQIKGIDVVRCKECKHFEKNESILRGEWWCDLWMDTIEDDGYCSYGEREE